MQILISFKVVLSNLMHLQSITISKKKGKKLKEPHYLITGEFHEKGA